MDIRSFGFNPITEKDFKRLDHELFARRDIQITESFDFHVRMEFVSENTIAVSWTRGPAGEVSYSGSHVMEVVFLDARTGALKHRQKWPVNERRWSSDSLDSEGRIVPIQNDRYIVHAAANLYLYSADFQLVNQFALTGGPQNSWSVQVLPNGKVIFLWHESLNHVEYEWRDAESFSLIRRGSGIPSDIGPMTKAGALPFDNGFYVEIGRTLQPVPSNAAERIVCDAPQCKYLTYNAWLLEGGKAILAGGSGFVVFSANGQQYWSRETSGETPSAWVTRSLDGRRFALWMFGKGGKFDGVRLSDDPTFFVYDVESKSSLLTVRPPGEWDFTFALSSDGSRFAVFSGTKIQVYAVPLPRSSSN